MDLASWEFGAFDAELICCLPGRSNPIKRTQQVQQQVATGKLKAYGVTQKAKMPEFPNAESMVELLGPKLEVQYCLGRRRRREIE